MGINTNYSNYPQDVLPLPPPPPLSVDKCIDTLRSKGSMPSETEKAANDLIKQVKGLDDQTLKDIKNDLPTIKKKIERFGDSKTEGFDELMKKIDNAMRGDEKSPVSNQSSSSDGGLFGLFSKQSSKNENRFEPKTEASVSESPKTNGTTWEEKKNEMRDKINKEISQCEEELKALADVNYQLNKKLGTLSENANRKVSEMQKNGLSDIEKEKLSKDLDEINKSLSDLEKEMNLNAKAQDALKEKIHSLVKNRT